MLDRVSCAEHSAGMACLSIATLSDRLGYAFPLHWRKLSRDSIAGDGVYKLLSLRATQPIPIIFATVGDAVAVGLASALARPGGDVTGTSSRSSPRNGLSSFERHNRARLRNCHRTAPPQAWPSSWCQA